LKITGEKTVSARAKSKPGKDFEVFLTLEPEIGLPGTGNTIDGESMVRGRSLTNVKEKISRIGSAWPRIDARGKVTRATRYSSDQIRSGERR
jgi:hypothetical protein